MTHEFEKLSEAGDAAGDGRTDAQHVADRRARNERGRRALEHALRAANERAAAAFLGEIIRQLGWKESAKVEILEVEVAVTAAAPKEWAPGEGQRSGESVHGEDPAEAPEVTSHRANVDELEEREWERVKALREFRELER